MTCGRWVIIMPGMLMMIAFVTQFQVGVITYILLSGFSPFLGDTDADTFSNISRSLSKSERDRVTNVIISV